VFGWFWKFLPPECRLLLTVVDPPRVEGGGWAGPARPPPPGLDKKPPRAITWSCLSARRQCLACRWVAASTIPFSPCAMQAQGEQLTWSVVSRESPTRLPYLSAARPPLAVCRLAFPFKIHSFLFQFCFRFHPNIFSGTRYFFWDSLVSIYLRISGLERFYLKLHWTV